MEMDEGLLALYTALLIVAFLACLFMKKWGYVFMLALLFFDVGSNRNNVPLTIQASICNRDPKTLEIATYQPYGRYQQVICCNVKPWSIVYECKLLRAARCIKDVLSCVGEENPKNPLND